MHYLHTNLSNCILDFWSNSSQEFSPDLFHIYPSLIFYLFQNLTTTKLVPSQLHFQCNMTDYIPVPSHSQILLVSRRSVAKVEEKVNQILVPNPLSKICLWLIHLSSILKSYQNLLDSLLVLEWFFSFLSNIPARYLEYPCLITISYLQLPDLHRCITYPWTISNATWNQIHRRYITDSIQMYW